MFDLKELKVTQHRTDICYTPDNGVDHLVVLLWLMAQKEVNVYRLYRN